MTFVKNTKTPASNLRLPIASFRVELFRDGDRIVLDTPQPVCPRQFCSFTVGERIAYQNIVRFILDQSQEAMARTREEIAARNNRKQQEA